LPLASDGSIGESGPAGRKFDRANNIEVNLKGIKMKGPDWLVAHSIVIDNVNLWIKQVEQKLKR
jgi:hypothetical protein